MYAIRSYYGIKAGLDLGRTRLVAGALLEPGQAAGTVRRVLVAQLGEHRRDRLGFVHFMPEMIQGMAFLARVAEDRIEMAADFRAMDPERGQQPGVVVEAHGLGDALTVVAIGGQVVGLGVVQILEAIV